MHWFQPLDPLDQDILVISKAHSNFSLLKLLGTVHLHQAAKKKRRDNMVSISNNKNHAGNFQQVFIFSRSLDEMPYATLTLN